MIGPQNPGRVFLAAGSTDMRKSINGLSFLVEQALDLNHFAGDLFVFCNRRRNMIKILNDLSRRCGDALVTRLRNVDWSSGTMDKTLIHNH